MVVYALFRKPRGVVYEAPVALYKTYEEANDNAIRKAIDDGVNYTIGGYEIDDEPQKVEVPTVIKIEGTLTVPTVDNAKPSIVIDNMTETTEADDEFYCEVADAATGEYDFCTLVHTDGTMPNYNDMIDNIMDELLLEIDEDNA